MENTLNLAEYIQNKERLHMNYKSPEIEIIELNMSDVITTSGGLNAGGNMNVGEAEDIFG